MEVVPHSEQWRGVQIIRKLAGEKVGKFEFRIRALK
jgi:hypothetical protein